MKKPFSKKLLILDYFIMVVLLVLLVVCACANGIYAMNATNEILQNGADISSIAAPFDVSTIGIVVTAWAAQLAVSSGAYYILIRSDHKMEYPIMLIKELPEEIKDKVDYDNLISSVLANTGN